MKQALIFAAGFLGAAGLVFLAGWIVVRQMDTYLNGKR